ncbi:hypothetical protein ACOI1H_17050 [Loktanella sp. DJP18]|uniref:hypothetical protein n=1 Tax=Loktanella sp. DJP18 TaxID=3409788 RepID=UPI003BB4BE38
MHLLFDTHENALSNGVPTESSCTGPQALAVMNPPVLRALLPLFPDQLRGADAAIGASAARHVVGGSAAQVAGTSAIAALFGAFAGSCSVK